MLLTSAILPAAATGYWIVGLLRRRRLLADLSRAPQPRKVAAPLSSSGSRNRRPEAVLLDRDGTLVVDVPYNGDPGQVVPMPGAREALDRLRSAGVPLAVISNQSGVARGLLTPEQVRAVNRRVEELLGPLGPWAFCPHGPDDGCGCRKPAPGLVLQVAKRLGVDPARCVVIGDIGTDVEAARTAGARGILVPTHETRPEEVEAAPEVVPDLGAAVDLLLKEAR
jgi:histidinol-phosphate phosphatase family protein